MSEHSAMPLSPSVNQVLDGADAIFAVKSVLRLMRDFSDTAPDERVLLRLLDTRPAEMTRRAQ